MAALAAMERSPCSVAKIIINRTSTLSKLRAGAIVARLLLSWNPALHGAMDAGPQEGYFGLAVEGPQRRAEQLGSKTRLADILHYRALGFIPDNAEPVFSHGP